MEYFLNVKFIFSQLVIILIHKQGQAYITKESCPTHIYRFIITFLSCASARLLSSEIVATVQSPKFSSYTNQLYKNSFLTMSTNNKDVPVVDFVQAEELNNC